MKEVTLQKPLDLLAGAGTQQKHVSGANEKSFGEVLQGSIAEVNKLQNEANQAIEALAVGAENDLHHTMIAMEKAEISFKLMMQVRNKIVAAYEEIMRMQV